MGGSAATSPADRRTTRRSGPLKVSGSVGGREVWTLLRSMGVVSTGTAARAVSEARLLRSPGQPRVRNARATAATAAVRFTRFVARIAKSSTRALNGVDAARAARQDAGS